MSDPLDSIPSGTGMDLTMAESVALRLRPLIIDGTLPPGTRLRLVPLARRLGVSVMPVRDALRLLEADRLVVVTPRRGAVVSTLSFEDAEETYAVRVALESLCARHAAERLTDADVVRLDALFANMAEAAVRDALDPFIRADHRFHEALYAAAGRPRLIEQIADLTERSRRYLPQLYRAWQMAEDPLEAHRPLLEAIHARDPERVAALTREHMEAASGRLLAAITEDRRSGAGHAGAS